MSVSGNKRTELRTSNTGNIFLQLVGQQTLHCNLRLSVARITTSAQQILMLQNVETASIFCNMNFFLRAVVV